MSKSADTLNAALKRKPKPIFIGEENSSVEVVFNEVMGIADIKNIDGKIFALLSKNELEVYTFFRDEGQRVGVSVKILPDSDVDRHLLENAKSQGDKEEILRRSNSKISVKIESI